MRTVYADNKRALFWITADNRAFYGREVRTLPDTYAPVEPDDAAYFCDRVKRMWAIVQDNLGVAYRQARADGHRGDAADELVHAVGIAALMRAVWTYDGQSSLATWATIILRNAYRSHARKKEPYIERLDDVSEPAASNGRVDLSYVWQYVRALKQPQRRLIYAHVLRGESCRTIAAASGVSKTKASKDINAALTALRKAARNGYY